MRFRQPLLKGIYMRWVKRWIAVAVLSMSTALACVGASYGQDKVVRIGFQKYGKLVLLKSRALLLLLDSLFQLLHPAL